MLRHLGSFHVLDIVDSAAENMGGGVHVPFFFCLFFLI